MKKALRTGSAAALALVIIAAAGAYFYYRDAVGRKPSPAVVKNLIVPPGYTTAQIGALLQREGLVADGRAFAWYCRFHRLDGKLEAGPYCLSSADGIPGIATTLARGRIHRRRVTIPEGYDKEKTARAVAAAGVGTREAFLAACRRGDPKKRVPTRDLEGYLYPDTYEVAADANAADVVAMMLDRFFEIMGPAEMRRAEKAGRSLKEIVIVASLVEREAMLPEEKPLVASVFYNRLAKGMRLESCATVIYALGRQTDRLTVQDLKVDSPYNTYLHAGLPPGPICSPGEVALRAALAPAVTDYLFFVSNGDGSHTFSRTLAEHMAARRKAHVKDGQS